MLGERLLALGQRGTNKRQVHWVRSGLARHARSGRQIDAATGANGIRNCWSARIRRTTTTSDMLDFNRLLLHMVAANDRRISDPRLV